MESFVDMNATSSASTLQPAALPRSRCNPCNPRMGANNDGKDAENCADADDLITCATAATSVTKTITSTNPPATMTGRARFQGNGIGGGAAASRRTASMTEAVKPDDGRISSLREKM